MSDPFLDELAAALAPHYALDRELTGAGMSRVFVAREVALGRTVVVKVLKPDLAAGVNRDRFRREIMVVAQLNHPHIVPVLTAGEHGDLLWFTMPFVEGESMRDALARGERFTSRDVVRVLHDVLDALAYAHGRGVVHRDIKPGNILRHGSHSLVTDFGVAKAISASLPHSGTTSVGIAIGTPAYMAPEQLAADPTADHRIDLYATGLLAYELLTGAQPFAGASPQETMAAQLTRMPTPLEECCPDVSPALAALVTRLLAKRPDDRPASARAALDELEAFSTPAGLPGDPSTRRTAAAARADDSTAPLPNESAPRAARRRRLLLAALGAVVALGAAGALLSEHGQRVAARSAAAPAPVPAPEPAAPSRALPATPIPPAPRRDSLSRRDSARRVDVPRATGLTRDDSLRIAEAVRRQLETTHMADAARPGADRDLDSLQRVLVDVYTDSTLRTAHATLDRLRRGGIAIPPEALAAISGAAMSEARGARGAHGARGAFFAAPGAGALGVRRVALLPVRDGTNRADLGPAVRASIDRLRTSLAGAGYTLADDRETEALSAAAPLPAQRQIAAATRIGAVLTPVATVRGDMLDLQVIALDVWRGEPLTAHAVLDPREAERSALLAGQVLRALARVAWFDASAPLRILLFDVDDPAGRVGPQLASLSSALRVQLAQHTGIAVVSDTLPPTRDLLERRARGVHAGAQAIVAAVVTRADADSVTLRLSARDLVTGRSVPSVEVRASRVSPADVAPLAAAQLAGPLREVLRRP